MKKFYLSFSAILFISFGSLQADDIIGLVNLHTGEVVSGTVVLSASSADPDRTDIVEFYIDERLIGTLPEDKINNFYAVTWDTTQDSDGDHRVKFKVIDNTLSGPGTFSNFVTVFVNNSDSPTDIISPIVSIIRLDDNDTVQGELEVEAFAIDNDEIKHVEFFVDGVTQGTDSTRPFTFMWNTVGLTDGPHTLKATVIDMTGNTAEDSVSVQVANAPTSATDTIPPTISFEGPKTVSLPIKIEAIASDNVAVKHVEFYVDGELIETDTTSPYIYWWSTHSFEDGPHTLLAKAVDMAGNTAEDSFTTTLGLRETMPSNITLRTPENSEEVSGIVTIMGEGAYVETTDIVDFYIDGRLIGSDTTNPYSVQWDTTQETDGDHEIKAFARNITGWFSTRIIVFVNNANSPTDIIFPVVSIGRLEDNDVVGGEFDVKIFAMDNDEVKHVEIFVDGALQETDSTRPFIFRWNTFDLTNGDHTLKAIVTDPAGNTAEDSVTVQVTNGPSTTPDTVSPFISMEVPETVTSSILIEVTVSDNVGVKHVEFYVDNEPIETDTTSPFSFTWNTLLWDDGLHILLAKAVDMAGNAALDSSRVWVANADSSLITLPPARSDFNPARGQTLSIYYPVQEDGAVEVSIYNRKGDLIQTLTQGSANQGVGEVRWNGHTLTGDTVVSGLYICRIKTASGVETKKVMVIK